MIVMPKITEIPDAVVAAVEDVLADFGYDVGGDCSQWIAYEAVLAWLRWEETRNDSRS